jgi:hypothetical protein
MLAGTAAPEKWVSATRVACAYCQETLESTVDGKSLVSSARAALEYSRAKLGRLAADYGLC